MVYLFIIVASLFLIIGYDFQRISNKGKIAFLFLILFVSFLAGFRYMIGADTVEYYDFFKNAVTLDRMNSSTLSNTRFQPGYPLLVSLVKSTFGYFFVIQLIVALLLNLTLYHFIITHSKYLFTSFLIYFILNYLEFNTEIQREAISISLGLIAYMFYEKKKYLISLFLTFLAFEFHISAIAILLYPLLRMVKFSYKSFVLVLVSVCVILPISYLSIPDLYDLVSIFINLNNNNWKTDQFLSQELLDDWNFNFFIVHALRYVVLPFSAVLYNERRGNTCMVGFVYMWSALQFLNMYSYGFYRFANYFVPFVWLYYSLFIISFIKSHLNKCKMVIVLFFVLLLYFYQTALLREDDGFSSAKYNYERYFPYKSIFTESLY